MRERLAAIRAGMERQGVDALIGVHDGSHFIETPNPVMVMSGYKSLGPAAAVLYRDGESDLIVTSEWEHARATAHCPTARVHGDGIVPGLAAALRRRVDPSASDRAIGIAGLT